MHKLRAFIGEPKAFLPEHVLLSGCLFRLRMFMWFTDLNKGMLNHRPKKKQPRGCRYKRHQNPKRLWDRDVLLVGSLFVLCQF